MPQKGVTMHLTHQARAPRRSTGKGRSVRTLSLVAAVSFALIAGSCTNPGPTGGYTLTLKATQISNESFVGDWPTTFWDPDSAEEPYLVHMGLRISLDPINVTTTVKSTYLNGGSFIGKVGAGESIPVPGTDGITWSGVQLPDVADLANGAPLEILGSVEFLFDRDQLIPLGIANVLAGVSDAINAALPPILANGGIPSSPQGIIDLLSAVLPSVFTVVVGAVQAVVGNLTGSDTFFGFQPVMFVAVGGGLGDVLQGALPSVMNLVNAALKALPDSPLPNGLPLSLGVARHGINVRFGTPPATSQYKVRYGWS
jgi:hypothetical protein